MGLFSKDRSSAQPSFGHAAFDPADVEDARRGHPAVTLEHFAAATGFTYRGSELLGSFLSTLPTWQEYVCNVCRGAMPSGRLAQVAHELLELEAKDGSVRAGGTFYDVRVTTHMSLREMASISVPAEKNEPFAANAVWVPTTTVHVRAPETARLPVFTITRSNDRNVPAALADACRPWLATRPDAYVNLRVRYGVVALTVNGYRANNDDLHHLLQIADGIASALAGLMPAGSGAAFHSYGPAASTVALPAGVPLPHPLMVPAYAQAAAELGMHNEDISYLMGMFPRCPIPGVPSGVLAGNLPGTAVAGRLVWFEQGGRTSGSVRGGVVVPAVPGATTPVGGVLDTSTAMYTEVVDGMAACWRQQRSVGRLESRPLLEAATATLRANGLAAV